MLGNSHPVLCNARRVGIGGARATSKGRTGSTLARPRNSEKRAQQFDPYPDNQIAPEVVGGRPRVSSPIRWPSRSTTGVMPLCRALGHRGRVRTLSSAPCRPGGFPGMMRPCPHHAAQPTHPPPSQGRLAPSPARPKSRLQKVLAAAGIGSRRQCEELIRAGRIEVDRAVVTRLGTTVDAEHQEIRVDGVVLARSRRAYYAVHKPRGVVTTHRDPAGRPRVIDFVPSTAERLFPVGRLDLYSDGLILLTNDGELANQLTHPRYEVEKTYRVLVAGEPTPEVLAKLKQGIHLAEGVAKVHRIQIKKRQRKSTLMELTLREGRNREVRRVLARVGHKVLQLTRIAVGPVRLGNLPVGAHRKLTHEEVEALRQSVRRRRCGGPMSDPAHCVCYADRARQLRVEVEENVRLACDTYRLRFRSPEIAQRIVPGQFLMVRLADTNDPLLGRPLALYDTVVDSQGKPVGVDIVYMVIGKATRRLALLAVGSPLEVWGPLGNGFSPAPAEHLLMVAGGIGQTPFMALAREFLGLRAYGDPPRRQRGPVPIGRPPVRVTLCYGARTARAIWRESRISSGWGWRSA